MTHCQNIGRSVHLFNLDPAAEKFEYNPTIDIRDLITLEDVMEELQYGPNGGLIYCLEFLLNNMDWLEDELGEYEDDYLIIDCPGQIELYTHFPIMRRICECLQRMHFRICGVYLLESQFIQDNSKFFAGVMSAMSAMVSLEIPHINVLSKMDLLGKFKKREYFDPDPLLLAEEANTSMNPKFHDLNRAIVQLSWLRLKTYNIKIYSYTSHLVILLNTPANEEIIIKELAEMGVKKSDLRVVNNEMGTKEKFKEHVNSL
ncbi:35962_t:CDS:2 [Gigaspora margarita]|uniref:GPN-loop GTPase 3 n=1 Tax=Gigaspora margarita TaxID=4874 RepID=A0ABN7UBY0_GIGMA|nr:35962_t:CDS:2 [Gigaspora margarita]